MCLTKLFAFVNLSCLSGAGLSSVTTPDPSTPTWLSCTHPTHKCATPAWPYTNLTRKYATLAWPYTNLTRKYATPAWPSRIHTRRCAGKASTEASGEVKARWDQSIFSSCI